MKYMNAKDILPSELLDSIQKYVVGKAIYIPQRGDTRKGWGSKTETRQFIYNRNKRIKSDKNAGKTIDELMAKYHLSYDTVKKIVYSKK